MIGDKLQSSFYAKIYLSTVVINQKEVCLFFPPNRAWMHKEKWIQEEHQALKPWIKSSNSDVSFIMVVYGENTFWAAGGFFAAIP